MANAWLSRVNENESITCQFVQHLTVLVVQQCDNWLNARSFISTMLAKIFTRDAQDHFLVQTTHFKQIFKAVQNPRGSN